MRSDVTQFELAAPATLEAVLRQLASSPATLIAGGTELMVALAAGRLTAGSFVSIQHLRELRFIRETDAGIEIGSGTTFSDIRRSALIAQELPLLVQAASWTGSVANQNRGTVGGNICNASPAADTPPALLAYEASVTLLSLRGQRTLPYAEFHLGYKRTVLACDELLYSITVPRGWREWRPYIRKVGTRNAQAISKIALAGLARVHNTVIEDIRLGAASLADRPIRCVAAESALRGRALTGDAIASARSALMSEARPIDDIRSTARYRAYVAANLLEEFLRSLQD